MVATTPHERSTKKEEHVKTEQEDQRTSYRLIQDKLSDKTELYKLHLEHYHMSTAAFKHRASELKLSPEDYRRYEEVVKE